MKESKKLKWHPGAKVRRSVQQVGRRGRAQSREKRIFLGAWVPESLARTVNGAVPRLGFKNLSQFLRSALEGSVEEFKI
jgi:hypothetical protein